MEQPGLCRGSLCRVSGATCPYIAVTSHGVTATRSEHPKGSAPQPSSVGSSPRARPHVTAFSRVRAHHLPNTSGRRCSSTSTEPSSGVTKWHTGFLRFSKSGRGEGETLSLRSPAPWGDPEVFFSWKMRFAEIKGSGQRKRLSR